MINDIKQLLRKNKVEEAIEILERYIESDKSTKDNFEKRLMTVMAEYNEYKELKNNGYKYIVDKLTAIRESIYNILKDVEAFIKTTDSTGNEYSIENTKDITSKKNLHQLITSKYFKDSQYDLNTYNVQVSSDFSQLFSCFLTDKTEEFLKEEKVADNDIIRFLSKKIIESNYTFPILVDGYSGTGKSLLLGLIYIELYNRSLEDQQHFCPIYINLHHYEYYVYQTENIEASAKDKLRSDLNELINCKEVKGKKMILIVDGADQYIKPKVDLYDEVLLEIEKFDKKIVGIRKFRSEKLSRRVSISGDPEFSVRLNGVLVRDNNFLIDKIVKAYAKVIANYSIRSKKKVGENFENVIKQFINDYNLYDLDLFSLRLLTEVARNPLLYDTRRGISSILETYCKKKYNYHTKKLDGVAKLSFETFNLINNYTSLQIDNSGWELISSHHTIRNYLIAKHVVYLLRNPQKNDFSHYDFVYPHEVNSFIKQIFNENRDHQYEVLRGVKHIWKHIEEVHINTRTHLAYLLGRFKDPNIAEEAYKQLQKIKQSQEFEDILNLFNSYKQKSERTNDIPKEDRSKLLFLRTVYISLIYLGQNSKSKKDSIEYINFCLKNPFLENLNRGFHLEYYGDIQYHPGEADSLKHQDELHECNLTFNKLIDKLEAALRSHGKDDSRMYYSMFEVEIFTICSLAQHRAIGKENKLNKSFKERLGKLLDNVFDQRVLEKDSKLWDYLVFVKTFVCCKLDINVGELYNLMSNLKRRHRRGWEIKGKMNKHMVERVSSHVWSTEDIAFRFLPEDTDEDGYNKYEIIKMLHFHDSAEAFTSDFIRGEKGTKEREEELKWISIMSASGMINEFSKSIDIKDMFREFEGKTTINAKYANDCDKLECLLQTKNYYIRRAILEDVYKDFRNNLISELKTPWGNKIAVIFDNINEHYLEVEKVFIQRNEEDIP